MIENQALVIGTPNEYPGTDTGNFPMQKPGVRRERLKNNDRTRNEFYGL